MPTPEKNTMNNPEEILEQPTREISQTDHLNKKLLTSLFNRMNDGEDSNLNKMLEPDNIPEDEDEWKD
ncbi:hypothetical protein ABMA27_010021 [Loxostege sticticalis]|uniref:Uncharacterized protein n=1 Tax=Loxostege sticticalis TaxID=481309 RepID=A0ABR3H797_LOXSC